MSDELPKEQEHATCHSGSEALKQVRQVVQAVGGGGSAGDGMADEWHSAVVEAPSLDDDNG